MDNFKQASKEKLRFNTSKGLLTVEQLWDLSITDLDTLAVSLEEEHKHSGKKSFVVKRSVKDKVAKLRFEIALEILQSKVEDQEELANAAEIKEHNAKIMRLIQDKKEGELAGKSVEELEKMLK
jgi:uncharacterized membrane protein